MREAFAGQLRELEQRIVSMLHDAVLTLGEIAEAIPDATPAKIGQISRGGRQLRGASRRIDADLVTITARQAPVASDLRLVLALIQLAQHASLISNQFELISEQLAETDPAVYDAHGTADKLVSMATLAGVQLTRASTAFTSRDLELARQLDRDDDQIDRLNREVFEAALRLTDDVDYREQGLRYVLIARCLERVADNAVDIAAQTRFLLPAASDEIR